jgi:hypothetical protein
MMVIMEKQLAGEATKNIRHILVSIYLSFENIAFKMSSDCPINFTFSKNVSLPRLRPNIDHFTPSMSRNINEFIELMERASIPNACMGKMAPSTNNFCNEEKPQPNLNRQN